MPPTKRVPRTGSPLTCKNCYEKIYAINQVTEACTEEVLANGRKAEREWKKGDVVCPHCGLSANRRMRH